MPELIFLNIVVDNFIDVVEDLFLQLYWLFHQSCPEPVLKFIHNSFRRYLQDYCQRRPRN